jgi:hypothetical protein
VSLTDLHPVNGPPEGCSAGRIRTEVKILLACARRTLDAAHIECLRKNLEKPVDQPLLFKLATKNGLLPLLCEHLSQDSIARSWEMPASYADAKRRGTVRALFLTAELLRITESLCQRRIPVLSYKGPVLGQLAYGNPLLREFDDLDLVVPQRSMAVVYEEMNILGYEPRFSRERFRTNGENDIPGEYVFLHKVSGAMVEFHTEATLRHFPQPPPLEAMILRSTTVLLNGREVPTFALDDTLIMLCVHGAKDFWSRLIWVADIASLTGSLDDDGWEHVLSEAKKSDAERMVRLGLWLSSAILEPHLPFRVLQDIQRDRVAVRIGGRLRESLLDRKPLPKGVAWRSFYRMAMVPQLWRGAWHWIRLLTAPSEEDWSMTQNQPAFRASYTLLRPLRLLWKYGVRKDQKG